MPDSRCPSCGETISGAVPLPPESKPKDAIREDFREKKEPSDFTNNPFNERYEAAQSAVDENPYQTPKSDYPELKPQDEVKDPQRSGLKWILFSFEGRIPRSTYWAASIGLTVVLWGLAFVLIIICGGLMSAFAPGNRDQFSEDAFFLLFLLFGAPFAVIAIWSQYAIQAKRWHDRNKSGWWSAIQLIPYIGPIWMFVELGCLEGTIGRNQYGEGPRDTLIM
jgi:uncharacterized membrane protein YhaH (DUF805 family)